MPPRRSLFVAVCLFLFLASSVMAAEKQYTWKIATLAPKGIGWSKNLETVLIPALEKASGGNLRINWYWGGIMGDDPDYLKKMHIGQLHGMAASGRGMNMAVPEMLVLGLPFLFNSWEEVDYIRSIMYPVFAEYAEKHGHKLLYWADQDFDQLYSTDWDFTDLNDFKEAKFVVWNGPVEEAIFNALGAKSAPINIPEIPASIRQGIANALFAPSVWVVGTQCYTSLKFVNDAKMRYSPAGLVVSVDSWEALPEEYKQKILASRDAVVKEFCKRTRVDNIKAVDAMVNYGLQRAQTDPEDMKKIREACKMVWEEEAGREFPRELFDEVVFQLENYRKMKAGQKS